MNSQEKYKRRPLINFFIKPGLQFRLTLMFIVTSLVASFCSLGLIFLIIRVDIDGLEGLRTAWYYLKATYPGFWVATGVSLVVGAIVGTYASRKVALPIFKVEKWSESLKKGDLTVNLGMRDSDYWEHMASTCNSFTNELRDHMKALQKLAEAEDEKLGSEVKRLLMKYKI